MKKPLLSVIIPVFNRADTVGRIINRVLKQKMSDFELILVNDGSTDNSLAILKKFAKQDKRVRVIDQPNRCGGPSGGRNTGLENAKGEFILLLDSDDDIEPEMIPAMMKKQQTTNADLVVCAIKEVFPIGKTIPLKIESKSIDTSKEDIVAFAIDAMGKIGSLVYNPTNRIMRSSIIKKHNLKYLENLRFGEDTEFNMRYLKYAKKIEIMSEMFYIYHRDSLNSTFSESSLDYNNRVRLKEFLWKFAKTSKSSSAHDLAVWVQVRWFLSYCKIVIQSNLNQTEKKRRIIYACEHEKFKKLSSQKVLSKKHQMIIKATSCLITRPRFFYCFIKMIVPISSVAKVFA